jgi:peroxiredoxin
MKPMTFATIAILLCASTLPTFSQERSRRMGMRMQDTVRVGDAAPDFKLKTLDGAREVQLSAFRGKRPVVLVFGSYT